MAIKSFKEWYSEKTAGQDVVNEELSLTEIKKQLPPRIHELLRSASEAVKDAMPNLQREFWNAWSNSGLAGQKEAIQSLENPQDVVDWVRDFYGLEPLAEGSEKPRRGK